MSNPMCPPKGKAKGKKVPTAKMAAALRKPRQPAMPADPDMEAQEAEATQRGGYSRRGGGVGSG